MFIVGFAKNICKFEFKIILTLLIQLTFSLTVYAQEEVSNSKDNTVKVDIKKYKKFKENILWILENDHKYELVVLRVPINSSSDVKGDYKKFMSLN